MTPEALMRKVTKAFERADLQPLLDAIDDNTVWKSAATSVGIFRFGGHYRTRAGILEVTAQLAMVYSFRRFQPREIISRDEIAWGLFDAEVEHRPSGKVAKLEVALRWHVRNDMLLEHQAFFDTASLLAQQGGISRPA
jgi:ketosteroid isomerase-like protein